MDATSEIKPKRWTVSIVGNNQADWRIAVPSEVFSSHWQKVNSIRVSSDPSISTHRCSALDRMQVHLPCQDQSDQAKLCARTAHWACPYLVQLFSAC